MKKIIKVLMVLVIVLVCSELFICATGRIYEYFVKTTTGTTSYHFDKTCREIYVVTMCSHTAYVNWLSSYTVSTDNFLLGEYGLTDVIEHTEEVRSSHMTVMQNTAPVHIRIQVKE